MDRAVMGRDCLLPDHSFSAAVLQPRALKWESWNQEKERVPPFPCLPCELCYVLSIRPSPCSSGAPKTGRVLFGLETPPILELFNSPEHFYSGCLSCPEKGLESVCVPCILSRSHRAPADNPQALKEIKKKAVTLSSLENFFFLLHLPCSTSGVDRHIQGGFDWPHPGADSWELVPAWTSRLWKLL